MYGGKPPADGDSAKAYRYLKARLRAGHYMAGALLHVGNVAGDLGTSAAAARGALDQLATERFMDAISSGAFVVRAAEADEIEDLYRLNSELLQTAAALLGQGSPPPSAARLLHEILRHSEFDNWTCGGLADLTRRLFAAIAAATRNAKLLNLVERISDRLHAVRRIEAALLVKPEAELLDLCNQFYGAGADALCASLAQYHQRRIDSAAELCAAPAIAMRPPNRRQSLSRTGRPAAVNAHGANQDGERIAAPERQ